MEFLKLFYYIIDKIYNSLIYFKKLYKFNIFIGLMILKIYLIFIFKLKIYISLFDYKYIFI